VESFVPLFLGILIEVNENKIVQKNNNKHEMKGKHIFGWGNAFFENM